MVKVNEEDVSGDVSSDVEKDVEKEKKDVSTNEDNTNKQSSLSISQKVKS